ncbi:MAG: hypothetical protein MJE77_37080, partial [Proteobacteria bacterium]|nr:hypothetical protein [Pseudomonadota bacterium]
ATSRLAAMCSRTNCSIFVAKSWLLAFAIMPPQSHPTIPSSNPPLNGYNASDSYVEELAKKSYAELTSFAPSDPRASKMKKLIEQQHRLMGKL